MPYEIGEIDTSAPDRSGADGLNSPDAPRYSLTLWAHRSLPRTGFVWFIAGTAAMISLPLIALIGSPVLWGVLPFLMLAVAAIWWALQCSYRDREITEHLTIWPERITLLRLGPRGKHAQWVANPYWVTPVLHANGGPVPNYITLRGGDREVELGAFLSESERIALFGVVSDMLRNIEQANCHQTP